MKKKRFLIYFCICLSLFTLLGVSFFYLRKLNALEKNIERLGYSYQVIIQTSLLEKNLHNAESSQRGYILTGDSDFLDSYLAELKNIPEIMITLDMLTKDNSYLQQNLDTLTRVLNQQLLVLKQNMTEGVNDTLAPTRFEESNIYMNTITRVIGDIKRREAKVLMERSDSTTQNTSENRKSSFLSLIISFIVCCIAAVCVIWFFNRNEKYRHELEDKLSKLTILNTEIKGLTIAGTHNLQEPMRKVQTIIDRLQHITGLKDPELNQELNRIKDIYSKQQATNNTIIDYFNILTGSTVTSRIDLKNFIHELKAGNTWTQPFTMEVGDLKMMDADVSQLRLLFTHIINNSIQFNRPGQELRIVIKEETETIQFGKREKFYCIGISDNGIGIDDTYKDRIFNLFEKIELSSPGTKQNGMGLSFCKRIMLNHDGWISARKNQQLGTTIFLFFPNSTLVGK